MKHLLHPIVFVLALCVPALSGCVGAPRSLDQIDQMDPGEYEAWSQRVEAWSEAAGYTAVQQGADVEKIQTFCAYLSAVTDPVGSVLGDAANVAGFDEPLVRLLVLEAQSLLSGHGGLPNGERGLRLLARISVSVSLGAGKASAARP